EIEIAEERFPVPLTRLVAASLEPERRSQGGQGRIGHGQLLVGGRGERQGVVLGIEWLAGRQVDGERCRSGRRDMGDTQCLREPCSERALRERRRAGRLLRLETRLG